MPTAPATPDPGPARLLGIQGAVLAGGGATRFEGRPKGLERVGGVRILDRVVSLLLEATGRLPLLVANDPDAPSWRPDLRVVADRKPGTATLGGLYTAVVEAPAPVLVVAWDMPFVPAGLLRALARGLDTADVALPASGGRRGVEPLAAAYGPATAAAMERALDRGDYRAIAFHPEVRVGILSEADVAQFGDPLRLFFNVNTAADLVRANAL